jgi:hypothetical protein
MNGQINRMGEQNILFRLMGKELIVPDSQTPISVSGHFGGEFNN